MSLNRPDPVFDAEPYKKPDGKWYVLRKIDRTTIVEKPATDEEIEAARAAARAKLAALDEPVAEKKAKK